MIVANPTTGLTFTQWANALTQDNGLSISPPLDEQDWARWARDLRDTINIGSTLPDPTYFEDWQAWAQAALSALENS